MSLWRGPLPLTLVVLMVFSLTSTPQARAQAAGATGTPRVLLVPLQRAEDVSSVVPGRVYEYLKVLVEMSRRMEVVTIEGLREVDAQPKEVKRAIPKVDASLKKADDALWDAKEMVGKGEYGDAIKLFKRAVRYYERSFDKLVDFDKYIDASLGVALAYFLAGYEDNGEEALEPVLNMRPDLLLDKRRVPKQAIKALERLQKLQAASKSGELEILSKPPGAEVFVDGIRQGVTPQVVPGVQRGLHVVRLVRDGHESYAKRIRLRGSQKTVKAKLKPIKKKKAKKKKKRTADIQPADLALMVREGLMVKGLRNGGREFCERYALDGIAMFYVRKSDQQFELAPFLYSPKQNKTAELEWITLDAGLTTMQVNLLVLEEKLNSAMMSFPTRRAMARRSKIYTKPKPPKPVAKRPVVVATPVKPPARKNAASPAPPTPPKTAKKKPTRPKVRVVRSKPAKPPKATSKPPKAAPRIGTRVRRPPPGQRVVAAERAPQPAPTPAPRPPQPVSVPEPAPVVESDTGLERPLHEQWWFWTIIVGAVAGGTAAAVILASDGGNDAGHSVTIEW